LRKRHQETRSGEKERKEGESKWREGEKRINARKYQRGVNCRQGKCTNVQVKAYRPFLFPNIYIKAFLIPR
jgi:hypothetical protein